MSNVNVAFTLRIKLARDAMQITITAFDGPIQNKHGWSSGWDSAGRVRLTCEVKHGSEVIFPAGQLTCALHGCSDSIEAKELVMSLVAMQPGDADADYFADYTPEQLAWVEQHGEALGIEREARYCDEDGNIRGTRRMPRNPASPANQIA
jgi:hypothetical protein